MGASGIEIFEDDEACDVCAEILRSDDLVAALAERVDDVLGCPSYLGYGQAFDALVPRYSYSVPVT